MRRWVKSGIPRRRGGNLNSFFTDMKTILAICLTAGLSWAVPSYGATNVVTTLADSGPGSLRSAILDANGLGGGSITFQVNGTITLGSALPPFAANIDVWGPGTNLLVVSGSNKFKIFSTLASTTNTLANLTVANGWGPAPFSMQRFVASGIANTGTLAVLNCLVRNCTNDGSSGMAIYNEGTIALKGCMIADCGSFFTTYSSQGAGLCNNYGATATMEDCVVTRCRARNGGGVSNHGQLKLIRTLIYRCANDWSQGNAAGIFNWADLTMVSCSVSNNGGGWSGGGIYSLGTLAATNTTFMGNGGQVGGGLLLSGNASLSGCTIANNYSDQGGGIFSSGSLYIENCTISGNRLGYTGWGNSLGAGAIWNAGTMQANSCTVISNAAKNFGAITNSGTFSAINCIFARNSTNDFQGPLTSQGYNLIQNPVACAITGNSTGNLLSVDPLLGPLQDNGGPTWTHALLAGSPATDAGAVLGASATDERGVSRPQGQRPDIGAFEVVCPECGPLLITQCHRNADGSVQLTASGTPGDECKVLGSPDALAWSQVGSATNVAGTLSFTDTTSAGVPNRFYRLQKVGPL